MVLLRDASANKCGGICSSYEIIANLLMTEREFLRHKKAYVRDVLDILDRRAADEADLIFRRHRENERVLFADISREISTDINAHYAELFAFFQDRPELPDQPLYRKALLNHLPAFIRENRRFRSRVRRLPVKIKCAILASEIASGIVYHGGWGMDTESRLRVYLKNRFK